MLKRRVHYSQTFLEFSQFSIAIKIEEGTLKKIKKEKKNHSFIIEIHSNETLYKPYFYKNT